MPENPPLTLTLPQHAATSLSTLERESHPLGWQGEVDGRVRINAR